MAAAARCLSPEIGRSPAYSLTGGDETRAGSWARLVRKCRIDEHARTAGRPHDSRPGTLGMTACICPASAFEGHPDTRGMSRDRGFSGITARGMLDHLDFLGG